MAILEISDRQVKKIINDYILEMRSTEEFEKLIIRLIKDYKTWQGADVEALLTPFLKQECRRSSPTKIQSNFEKQLQQFIESDIKW